MTFFFFNHLTVISSSLSSVFVTCRNSLKGFDVIKNTNEQHVFIKCPSQTGVPKCFTENTWKWNFHRARRADSSKTCCWKYSFSLFSLSVNPLAGWKRKYTNKQGRPIHTTIQNREELSSSASLNTECLCPGSAADPRCGGTRGVQRRGVEGDSPAYFTVPERRLPRQHQRRHGLGKCHQGSAGSVSEEHRWAHGVCRKLTFQKPTVKTFFMSTTVELN